MLDLKDFRGQLRYNLPLALRTTWRIGGPAKIWAMPEDTEDLIYVLQKAQESHSPVFILGNGSKVLIDDAGLPGVTLHLGSGFNNLQIQDNFLRAGAGVSLPKLARFAAQSGFAGFEHLIGIPGAVGASVVGNAGSGGRDMRHILHSIKLINEDLDLVTFAAEDLQLAYRRSNLQGRTMFVVEAIFNLQQLDDPNEIENRHNQILAKRRSKFPLDLPNAGSVFKSSPDQPAGRLIEAAGFKGVRIGDAQVSEKHANFIVNLGRATAKDVKIIIHAIQERVFTTLGIKLEPEVIYIPTQKAI